MPGQQLVSSPKRAALFQFQSSGDLLVSMGGKRLWNAGTAGKGGAKLTQQPDGNLVLYNAHGGAVWSADTYGAKGAYLQIQDDGNLVIYQGSSPIWAIGTNGGHVQPTGFVQRHMGHGGLDLGRVALAVGTGGASEIVHKVAPQVEQFVVNAVKVAGRAIGQAADSLVTLEHDISAEIAKIPYVGGPLAAIFDAGFHAAIGPMTTCLDVIIKGKRIDEAFMAMVQTGLQDFKAVGPYVQMIVSVIPGWGTAVSAAVGMGLALANGQPIDQILLAGVSSMIPGGPLAKAAVSLAYAGIHAAVSGEKLDISKLGTMAMGAAGAALGLPPAATSALQAGVTMAGSLCSGANLETALSHGIIDALPIGAAAKTALQSADTLALDLAHGKRIDKALMGTLTQVANFIPDIDPKLRSQLLNVAQTGVSLAAGEPPEKALMAALRNGAADSLISLGSSALPSGVKDAINSGLAVGNGVMHQARKVEALLQHGFPDKIADIGKQFAAGNPLVSAGRALCSGASEVRGFDIGQGLTSQAAKLFDITAMRNGLAGDVQKGFDMALAHRIGAVAHPVPTHLDAPAQAAHAMTAGLAAQHPANTAAILATIVTKPGAAAGVQLAVARVDCSASTQDAFRATCMHPGA